MLRDSSLSKEGHAVKASTAESAQAAPEDELPFSLDERPPGIVFYRVKESFYHPYALLQSMRWQEMKLTLRFATLDVEITGRGLQIIYAHLAAHRLVRLTEQGERYASTSQAAVYVSRITEVPRATD